MEGGGEVSDTPRTDFEESIQTQRFGVYMVKANFARTLERENAAMREAIREAHGFARNILKNYECGDDIDCASEHLIEKLQPFLKP
jgi:hypothetical protein